MPAKKQGKANGNGAHSPESEPLLVEAKTHYETLKELLDKIQPQAEDDARRAAWMEFKSIWRNQSAFESETIVDPLHDADSDEKSLAQFKLDHDLICLLIADINMRSFRSEVASAEIELLKTFIEKRTNHFSGSDHHLVDLARKAGADFSRSERRGAEGARNTGRTSEPDLWVMYLSGKMEADTMRTRGRERDEHGRFMSDHDDDHRSMRGSQYRERDDHGRFMSDDDDHRRSRSSSSHYRDRDENGRFMSDDDDHRHMSRRRDYDDDDRSRRSRSSQSDYDDRRRSGRPGGWYGDSEGHSQAARRGWDNPDHGPSGWYGDRERHSRASREGWDNPDHGPSGWYGDSEGHSRAARRGWDNADHGPSGWYGDSEGHSQAARRGWDDRRSDDYRSSRRDDDDDRRRGYRRRD